MSTDQVDVTTVVAVDPDTAFAVFTQEIDAWWKHGPRFRVAPDRKSSMRFEPGVGGRLIEDYDGEGDAFEHGRVSVWQPGRRLVFAMGGRDFSADESTEVEVRFEATDGGTRVTLEHRGWDAFPAGHPVRHDLDAWSFTAMMGNWWAELLVEVGQRAVSHR